MGERAEKEGQADWPVVDFMNGRARSNGCGGVALAAAAGRGDATWRAYLSTRGENAVNARDRIGTGPWHAYDTRRQIAADLGWLHGDTLDQARIGNAMGEDDRVLQCCHADTRVGRRRPRTRAPHRGGLPRVARPRAFRRPHRRGNLRAWVLDPSTLAHRFYRRQGELLVEYAVGAERIESRAVTGFFVRREWLDPDELPSISASLASLPAAPTRTAPA